MSDSTFNVTLTGTDKFLHIQKNEQNILKGLLWNSAGIALTATALSMTVAGVVFAGGAFLASTASLLTRPVEGAFVATLAIPAAAAVLAVDYAFVWTAAKCLSNSHYHLGPKYQIISA